MMKVLMVVMMLIMMVVMVGDRGGVSIFPGHRGDHDGADDGDDAIACNLHHDDGGGVT